MGGGGDSKCAVISNIGHIKLETLLYFSALKYVTALQYLGCKELHRKGNFWIKLKKKVRL